MSASGEARLRVLVVAGDRLARAGLAATLEAEGFDVVGRLDPDELGADVGEAADRRGRSGFDDPEDLPSARDPGGFARSRDDVVPRHRDDVMPRDRDDPSDLGELLEAFDADVVVVDLGGPGSGGDASEGSMAAVLDALIGDAPGIDGDGPEGPGMEDGEGPVLVALVDDAGGAARARSLGATAVLDREIHGEALAAALAAAASGLVVASPTLAEALARAGQEVGDPDLDRAGDTLTPRETEVLRHLADGRSNREIAHALSISPHTVKDHVDAILSKLGAASRTEAVVRAARSGLITI